MSDVQRDIVSQHPAWKVNVSQSGSAQWIDIVTEANRRFTIQVTPSDGIGVSEIANSGVDFGGHDEVFDELSEAITHIDLLTKS